jgi:hypothetical protein
MSRIMDSNLIRRQALYELLSEPDPPDLHRGFVRRLEGKPDRHAQLPLLAAKFVQARLLEIRERAPLAEELNGWPNGSEREGRQLQR